MSVEAITVVLNHSQAKGSTKLVLIGIANHHSENGAWPSVKTLAGYANLSERRIQQALQELVDLGELTIEAQGGGGYQQYKTNRYWITLTCPDECGGFPGHKAGVKPASSRGEARFVSGVKPVSPEPLRETKKNLRGEHPISEEWIPSPELMAMFETKWPDIDPDYHTEQFKLYYLSKGTKHKDWSLTFQRWMNTEQARVKTQPWRAGAGNSTASKSKKQAERQATDQFLAEMRELEKLAGPAPKCPHGENVALCKKCLQ